MLRNLLAILPLVVAAPITAQTVAIEVYGQDHFNRQAMTLDLSAEAIEGSVTLTTKGGQPLAPVIVLVGLAPVEVDLGIIGIDGALFVDPVAVSAPSYFEDTGESGSLTLPFDDSLAGLQFTTQAASAWFDGEQTQIALSNGIVMTFAG